MSIFNKIKVKRPKRSTFDLSHDTKFTMPFGWLVPTYWNYFEPNTTFRASSEIMARFAPMYAPLMHRVNIYTYWFQIPIRLLMNESDWEDFITGGRTGDLTIDYPKYEIASDNPARNWYLLDYMGVPNNTSENGNPVTGGRNQVFDAIPFRAYSKIWNEYFRDQNTTEEMPITTFTGNRLIGYGYDSDVPGYNEENDLDLDIISVKSRCWEKDYFTSALPWAQRGTPVRAPFTAITELAMDGTNPSLINVASDNSENITEGAGLRSGTRDLSYTTSRKYNLVDSVATNNLQLDVTPHTKARTIISGTINDLRTAFSLQRWYERNAVGGSRYIEQINAHFGVWADDYRLQRPKYLGGSRTPIAISEVLQTSESTSNSAQGTMSGRGFTMDKNGFVGTFIKEHSIIMCLVCCVPKPAYFQGMPRKLDIADRFDFVTPEFAHLGEQPVKGKELFYKGKGENEGTFGYQSRYAQYKYEPNECHGYFRDSLLFWHLARKFDSTPSLNRNFLTVDADRDGLNRIFYVEGAESMYYGVNHPIWAQMAFNIKVKRPLPYFSTPL